MHHLVRLTRAGYHQVPKSTPVLRVGEFFDALQIPELSLGDASATHTLATGGTAGPGSGMMVRFNKLIDWTQRVTGDLNWLAGRAVRRRNGLVTASAPGETVDGMQWVVTKAFNAAQVMLSRASDLAIDGVERVAGGTRNVWLPKPHHEYAVFLRLPYESYRAHELWLLEHSDDLVIGTPAEFRELTHAQLAHRRASHRLAYLRLVDRLEGVEPVLIVMTIPRVLARAPASLRASVVPAAWVLNEEPAGAIDKVPGAV
jgi:hypothetical protein